LKANPLLTNRPAILFVIPLIAGILVGWRWDIPHGYVLVAVLALAIPVGFFAFTAWNSTKNAVSFLLLLLIFLVGIFRITLDKNPPEKRELDRLLALPQPVTITGVVADPPKKQTDRIRFVVNTKAVAHGVRQFPISTSVLVTMDTEGISQGTIDSLEYGTSIQFVGALTYPGTARNPGEFDLRHYLQLQGIYARSFIEDPTSIRLYGEEGDFFFRDVVYPMRRSIAHNLDQFVGGEEAKFLKGLTIGDRSEIPTEVKSSFINSGVMHILAVSGLHVGLITVMLVVVFSAFRVPETLRIILVCVLLIFYIFLTGSSPSVVRAVVMAVVVFGAKLFDRKTDIMNSLAVAALIILFWDARQLLLPGFQLSFAAVLSIVLLYPKFYSWSEILPERVHGNRLANGVIRLFCLSVAAGLGTLPFTGLYFGKIPVIGFVANLVVVPLSGVVLAIGMTTAVFSFVWDGVALLYGEAARLFAAVLLESVKFFGNLSFSYAEASFSSWNMILFYIALVIAVNIGRWMLKRMIGVALLLANVLMYAWLFGLMGKDGLLRVTFLDVGQGDAVFVEFPDGKSMLIDAGPRGLHTDAGARFVVPFLKAKGISMVGAAVVSHPHSDHLGGIPAVLRGIPVSSVIDAGSYAKSAIFDEYLRLTDSVKAKRHILHGKHRIDEYNNIRIYALHPTGEFAKVDSSVRVNLNNQSLSLRIVYGSTSVLLSGDAEEEAEKRIVQTYGDFLRSDVLKVGHHGSSTSSTEEFLTAVRPDVAVISVGKNNKFRHPSQVVLERFSQRNVRTYRTDENNAVVLISDGKKWREEEWR
jgi:competence protein ComEC